MCDSKNCTFPEFHVMIEDVTEWINDINKDNREKGYNDKDVLIISRDYLNNLLHRVFTHGYYFERNMIFSNIRNHKCNHCLKNLDKHFKGKNWKTPLCKKCRELYKEEYRWFEETYRNKFNESLKTIQ